MSFPSSISGLLCRIEPASGSFQDSGRTQQAIANGDAVASATDQTGNATVTGSGVTLTLVNSTPWFSFDGTTSNFTLGKPAAFEALNDASFTISCAVQTSVGSAQPFQTILSKTPTGASKIWMMLNDGPGGTARGWTQAQRYNGAYAGRLLPSTPQVLTYRFTRTGANTGVEEWRVDGVLLSHQANTLPSWDSTSNWRIGSTDSPSFYFKGLIGPQLIYAGALSDADCESIEDYIRSTAGIPAFANFDTSANILFSGNSIMDGALASGESTTLPSQTMELITSATGTDFHYVNLGQSGAATENLANLAPQQIDGSLLSGATNVLVMWEISNSLAENGDSPSQAYDALTNYCAARRNAGWTHIILMSCLPRTSVESDREAVNTLLRADFSTPTTNSLIFTATSGVTYADLLYDVGNDPVMGQSGQNTNTTYYADGTHPTDAGYTHLAPGMRDSVLTFLPSLSATSPGLTAGQSGQITVSATGLTLTAIAGDYALSPSGSVTGATVSNGGSSATLTIIAPNSAGTVTVSTQGTTSNAIVVGAHLSSSSSHSSASSASSNSSSSQSSESSASSHSSESSSQSVIVNPYPKTIDGSRYLAIAQFYASAYEEQLALTNPFEAAVQQLRCLDDVTVTLALLGSFQTAYLLSNSRYSDTSLYLPAVRTMQRHVAATTGLSVDDWIAEVVPGGLIPYGWSVLSKLVGYDIDSVIDWSTETSSSSS